MKKKHIMIFQSGEPLPCDSSEKRKMRAWNLIDELLSQGHEISLISSKFDHASKIHRIDNDYENYHKNLKTYLINSPGYSNNISVSRLVDHIVLALNLFLFLKKFEKNPDATFIGFPPIETSIVLFKWAKKQKSKIFLDVKDLWPEIFTYNENLIKKYILKICFYPYFLLYRYMVKNSDYLVSITQEFIDYLNQDSNRKSNKNIVTYLTSKKSKSAITSEAKKDEILTIGFAGSFMDAFDFHPICTAINNINNNTNIQFLLAGDGGSRKKVQKMFTELTNVDFLGWLDGDELNEFFSKIDLFIIPLKQRNDFSLSFPNKAMDALSKSKPILCSCDGSLTNFLEKNQCGLYYDPSSNTDLSKILDNLYTDRTLITKMITNIERIYDNSFNHQKNYQHLVSKIVDSN